MLRDELITLLNRGKDNVGLRAPIQAAVALLESAKQVVICDCRGAAGEDRGSLAALYRHRHQRLSKRGMSIDGYAETVQSLSEREDGVVKLIFAEFPGTPVVLSVLVSSADVPVGCFIAERFDTVIPPR